MKKFNARLFCYNCGHFSNYVLPYGTDVQRGSYGSGTTVRIPIKAAPGWRVDTLKCPECGSTRVG